MESITSEKQNSLISIIVPIFNREATLPRLFRSLSRVTYRPLEVVLVDNGSTDQSLTLCQAFQKEIHQAETFSVTLAQESKKGACACRNKGTDESQGEYLYFFDSDDEISSTFLSELSPFLKENDVVCAPTLMVFEDGKKKRRACVPTHNPHDQILSASLSTQSFVIRKSFLKKIGNWDESLARWNDWELGVRILCHQPRLIWLPEKAYHQIYQHPQSISGASFTKDTQALNESIDKVEKDIRKSTTITEDQRRKALQALAAKQFLLAAALYKEGSHEEARTTYGRAKEKCVTPLFRLGAPLLYFLSKHRIPGLWRAFKAIV